MRMLIWVYWDINIVSVWNIVRDMWNVKDLWRKKEVIAWLVKYLLTDNRILCKPENIWIELEALSSYDFIGEKDKEVIKERVYYFYWRGYGFYLNEQQKSEVKEYIKGNSRINANYTFTPTYWTRYYPTQFNIFEKLQWKGVNEMILEVEKMTSFNFIINELNILVVMIDGLNEWGDNNISENSYNKLRHGIDSMKSPIFWSYVSNFLKPILDSCRNLDIRNQIKFIITLSKINSNRVSIYEPFIFDPLNVIWISNKDRFELIKKYVESKDYIAHKTLDLILFYWNDKEAKDLIFENSAKLLFIADNIKKCLEKFPNLINDTRFSDSFWEVFESMLSDSKSHGYIHYRELLLLFRMNWVMQIFLNDFINDEENMNFILDNMPVSDIIWTELIFNRLDKEKQFEIFEKKIDNMSDRSSFHILRGVFYQILKSKLWNKELWKLGFFLLYSAESENDKMKFSKLIENYLEWMYFLDTDMWSQVSLKQGSIDDRLAQLDNNWISYRDMGINIAETFWELFDKWIFIKVTSAKYPDVGMTKKIYWELLRFWLSDYYDNKSIKRSSYLYNKSELEDIAHWLIDDMSRIIVQYIGNVDHVLHQRARFSDLFDNPSTEKLKELIWTESEFIINPEFTWDKISFDLKWEGWEFNSDESNRWWYNAHVVIDRYVNEWYRVSIDAYWIYWDPIDENEISNLRTNSEYDKIGRLIDKAKSWDSVEFDVLFINSLQALHERHKKWVEYESDYLMETRNYD